MNHTAAARRLLGTLGVKESGTNVPAEVQYCLQYCRAKRVLQAAGRWVVVAEPFIRRDGPWLSGDRAAAVTMSNLDASGGERLQGYVGEMVRRSAAINGTGDSWDIGAGYSATTKAAIANGGDAVGLGGAVLEARELLVQEQLADLTTDSVDIAGTRALVSQQMEARAALQLAKEARINDQEAAEVAGRALRGHHGRVRQDTELQATLLERLSALQRLLVDEQARAQEAQDDEAATREVVFTAAAKFSDAWFWAGTQCRCLPDDIIDNRRTAEC